MPLQNRIDPHGRIFRTEERGLFMGNRGGVLHDENRVIVREQASSSWIICRTRFRGRARQVMAPGRYTELFFLDEATALAAGHRPCFECRRQDAERFLDLFRRVSGASDARASDIDNQLRAERRLPRCSYGTGKIAFLADAASLPEGTMFDHAGMTYLRAEGLMHPWWPGGYRSPVALPDDEVFVLTPRTTVRILAAGYRPVLGIESQDH